MDREQQTPPPATAGNPAANAPGSELTVRPPSANKKLLISSLVFVALTVGVFVYQFKGIDHAGQGPTWAGIDWRFGLLILLALPLEPLATSLRIWVVCRVLHRGVGMWSCVKADCANIGMAMLTPSQTGGGLAQIYILCKAGVSAGTSVTISLLSFLGTLIGLMAMGIYSIVAGGAGERAGALFAVAVWTLTVSVGLMLIGGLMPGVIRHIIGAISRWFTRITGKNYLLVAWTPPGAPEGSEPVDRMGPLAARLVDIVYIYRRDVGRFLEHGKRAFLAVVGLTMVFLFSRCLMAFLAVRFLGLHAGFLEVVEIQIPLLFIVYFAPTPGSAGIAEGASLVAMGGIVPGGFAPYYNLLWRFSTSYIQAMAGLVILAHELILDGATRLGRRHRAARQSATCDAPIASSATAPAAPAPARAGARRRH